MLAQLTNKAEILKIVKFGLVGGLSTLVHLGVAIGGLRFGLGPFAANLLGFAVAFFGSLLGHYFFTFTGSGSFFRAFRRYGVIAVTGFASNNVILALLEGSGRLGSATSLAIAILVIPVGTFIACKYWGFTTDIAAPNQ